MEGEPPNGDLPFGLGEAHPSGLGLNDNFGELEFWPEGLTEDLMDAPWPLHGEEHNLQGPTAPTSMFAQHTLFRGDVGGGAAQMRESHEVRNLYNCYSQGFLVMVMVVTPISHLRSAFKVKKRHK
jgi:hypothetical protein